MLINRPTRARSLLRDFLATEASGGLLLMGAAALALLAANSPLAPTYFGVFHWRIAGLDVLHWINDGLMALFFLIVGLEIKREALDGQLSTWSRRVLPGVAAAGGMLVPAGIYVALNWGGSGLRGWAIPSATDIAFALGILALLGRRVPASLKVFLTALAIIDDLGAIAIIAIFYTSEVSVLALAAAAGVYAVLLALSLRGVSRLSPYLLLGLVLWALVLLSGVHATLAGVALALTIPIRASRGKPDDPHSPLHRLERRLHPWVAFFILPLFGFANAGVSFAGMDWAVLLEPVPLGIILGLFIGKQIGIFGTAWLAIRAGLAEEPAGAGWTHLYGVSLLCGIGFTMSLFIGALAFPAEPELADAVRLGVLGGSLLSALGGWLVLRTCAARSG